MHVLEDVQQRHAHELPIGTLAAPPGPAVRDMRGLAPPPASPAPCPPAIEREWRQQWELFDHVPSVEWLFEDWVYPNALDLFDGADVLEAGCGGGHLMALVAPRTKRLVGLDRSADTVARARFAHLPHVEVRRGDLLTWDTPERFDVVYCVGVLHHTDDPDRAFANIARLVRPGGRLIVWVYSYEGNALLRRVVEPLRRAIFRHMSRDGVWRASRAITAGLWPIVHSLYRLPLPFLPYHEYFANFRELTFRRNAMNVFDKLNAPQTTLITHDRIRSWFDAATFRAVHVSSYCGVSWRGSGTRR